MIFPNPDTDVAFSDHYFRFPFQYGHLQICVIMYVISNIFRSLRNTPTASSIDEDPVSQSVLKNRPFLQLTELVFERMSFESLFREDLTSSLLEVSRPTTRFHS